jgi:iron complex outermembrane recepter protein
MMGMFGGGATSGRWNIALYHTVRFEDDVLIRPGVPVLDLLDGSATGGGGGSPRHEVEVQGGRFYRGIGFFAFGTWRAPTRIDGSPIPGGGTSDDLRFGSSFRVNLRAFVDLGQQASLTRAVPFLRNSRIRIGVDNLFDSFVTVTDDSGTVPLRYQRGYVDSIGRTFELSFRKQF